MTIIKTLQKFKFLWFPLRAIWRAVSHRSWFMPFLLLYLKLRVKRFQDRPAKKDAKIKVLAVHSPRYVPDQECLSEHPDMEIWVLPHDVQALINSIFIRDQAKLLEGLDAIETSRVFREGEIPQIKEGRERLQKYLERFLPKAMRLLKVDGMMSCSFFYLLDLDWQIACTKTHIPFFALHKENMQDPVVHEHMIKRYSDMHLKFEGQRLFLYNGLVKKVLMGAHICDEEITRIVGACRMDALINKVQNNQCASPKRQVTLFSSHHAIGLLSLKDHKGYFSNDRNDGFVNYFDQVHGNMVLFAKQNPDVTVYIKPKWGGRWLEEIKSAAKRIANIDLDNEDIPNLHIVWDTPAQQLIEESAVIVGINSTTLLESLIVGRRVVVPLFEEAADKYYDRHVYFKKYQDVVFNVVRAPNELSQTLLDELNEKIPARDLPKEIIEDYLGYFDDQAANRVVEQMKMDVQNLNAKKAK